MSCPWAKIEKPEPVNFADILSEEVAKDLQAKENKKLLEVIKDEYEVIEEAVLDDVPDEVLKGITDNSFESDVLITQMQYVKEKECDQKLKRIENKYTGASKVSVSFNNNRRDHLNNDFESESEEEEIIDIQDRKDWNRFDPLEKKIASKLAGYRMKIDGKWITAHDVVLNGRENACKLLSFPHEFQTGYGETFDFKLSNKVFNSREVCLEPYVCSQNEQVRPHKIHAKKEKATTKFSVDQHTRVLLNKMIVKQLFPFVNAVISIGKEAVILHADLDPSYPKATESWPKECAIKVFKTAQSEFKQRDKNIKDDYPTKDRLRNQIVRKTTQLWAEKEYGNLTRLTRVRVNCPQVLKLREHILVMSFIGKNGRPAPKLKDVDLSVEDFIIAYEEVKNGMKKMFEKAYFIHADLSEYNILWHEGQCYFIGVSQSVDPSHENAFHFLHRDCVNVTNFFGNRVPEIETPDELFYYITGCEYNNRIALGNLKELIKMKLHDRLGIESTYNFDTSPEKFEVEMEKAVSDMDLNLVEPPKA